MTDTLLMLTIVDYKNFFSRRPHLVTNKAALLPLMANYTNRLILSYTISMYLNKHICCMALSVSEV